MLWTILMFPMMLPFKLKNIKRKQIIRFSFVLLFAIIIILSIYKYFVSSMNISLLFSNLGLSSRTLDSFLSESFLDANGRDEIYGLALDLIKNGGLFGWGVYGDRYIIGDYFRWGYSHNLFLELFVSFGYIGGFVASLTLIISVYKLYKYCNDINKQIIFIVFLVTSMKLMFSNSFWYTASFWALLVIMIKWKKHKVLLK